MASSEEYKPSSSISTGEPQPIPVSTDKEKRHPEAEVKQLQAERLNSVVSSIVNEYKLSVVQRTGWIQKIRRLHQKRYGLRPEKRFPWPGSANVHLPLIDKTIRKMKPNYVGLVMNAYPTAVFRPNRAEMSDAAMLNEQFFHWLMHERVPDFFENVVMAVDYTLAYGFSLFKVVYRHETRDVVETFKFSRLGAIKLRALQGGDQQQDPMTGQVSSKPFSDDYLMGFFMQETDLDAEDPDDKKILQKIVDAFKAGEKKVTYNRREVTHGTPMVVALDPQTVIVPEDTTTVESARFIVHKMYVTEQDLAKKQRDGLYHDVEKVQQIRSSRLADLETGVILSVKQAREGVFSQHRDQMIEIWEAYTYVDLDGDGVDERVVLTIQPDSMVVLRAVPLPYDHGQWPFVYCPFEITDGRWYGPRGAAEYLEDLQTSIITQHNAKLDRITIQNAPVFKARYGSIRNPGNVRWIPGQTIYVNNMDDLQPVQIPVLDNSYQSEENVLRQWAEEFIGVTDFGNQNPLSVRSEARTATEVQSIQAAAGNVFSLDGQLFQKVMKRVYDQVWQLWMQYGPEDVEFRVEGQPNPISVTKDRLRGHYDIIPAGQIGQINRQAEIQRKTQKLLMYAQIPQVAALIKFDALVRQIERLDDPISADQIVKTPQEIQQEQQMAMQQQQAPMPLSQALQGIQQHQKAGNGSKPVQMPGMAGVGR